MNVHVTRVQTHFTNGNVVRFPRPDARTLVEMENRRACYRLAEVIVRKEFEI